MAAAKVHDPQGNMYALHIYTARRNSGTFATASTSQLRSVIFGSPRAVVFPVSSVFNPIELWKIPLLAYFVRKLKY